MSQVITNAFEQYWQSSLAAEQPVVLDEFILADIPNLDITSPIDPDTILPPESQIVHRQSVDQRGRINNNAVAYTIVMDTTVGDFSFNAMYLRNKQNGVIGMIVYKGRETKLKTDQTTGQTGNSLVKSMLMGYDQAAEATLTNVDAGTWQIDYAARLRGMDEDIRQLQADLYGHHTFVGDGFKVVETDGAFQVTPGVAIVGGLRVELKQPEVIYPGTKPIGVWVDVHRAGSLLSEHQNHFTIITSVADLADHVDSNGYQHFVAKLGAVQADNTVVDGRGQGGSSGTGGIPDTFTLWKRSMAEAGYDLIGKFGSEITIQNAKQVLLSKDGTEVFAWTGGLPKTVTAQSSPVGDDLWVNSTDELLSLELSSNKSAKGSSLIGDHVDGTVAIALEKARVNNREVQRRAYAEIGCTLRDEPESFEGGGKLTSASDVLLHLSSGKAYASAGPFPLDIAKGTNPLDGGFIDKSEILLRDSIGVFLEDFGAVGTAKIDPESGIVSGTDSTAAIKAAVRWMNEMNNIAPENGGCYGFKLLGKPGATYRVTGNNILGNQRAEAGETTNLASSFYFDGNGCTFIWTPTGVDDSWVDYAATYYRPTIKNYRTLVAGTVNARAVLRSHSGPSGNVFQEGCFDDTVFTAGSDPSGARWRKGNYLETVFDLDGTTMNDRCSCRKSKFTQFKRMFRSANPEAVAWVLDGTSFWSWVAGTNYIEMTKTFSGAHTHIACDVVLFGENSKLVYAKADNYATYKNNGELYLFAPRVETHAANQFTAVYADHGHIIIDGLNCRNGNASFNAKPAYLSCEIYNDATVTFRNSVLPSRARMMIVPRDNVADFPGFVNAYGAVFENCEFQNYEYRPEYVTALGVLTTYRNAIQGQYYARNSKVSGSKAGNGTYGNCDLADNCDVNIPVFSYNANGISYLDPDVLTPLQPSCVITELLILVPADTEMTKFDVSVANIVIRTVNVTAAQKNKIYVINTTEWGIASPTPGAGAKLKIQPYNASGSIPRAKGMGFVKTRPARNLSDLTADDTPKII